MGDRNDKAGRNGGTAAVGSRDGGSSVPDDTDARFPGLENPEATEFVWATSDDCDDTREGEQQSGRENPERDISALEEQVSALSSLADSLSLLATNANLQLARGDGEALRRVARDLDADARRLERTVSELEERLDRLLESVDGTSASGDKASSASGETAPRTRGGLEGSWNPSPPDPQRITRRDGGSRRWRVAGVDLTRWPGHLGSFDFERARADVLDQEETAGEDAEQFLTEQFGPTLERRSAQAGEPPR